MRQYRPAPSAVTLSFSLSLKTLSLTSLSLTSLSLTGLSLPILATAAHAAPCPHEVVAARAALGPSAPQTIAAQLHRQPTVASVAAAERRADAAFGCAARHEDRHQQRDRRRLH